MLEKQMRNWRQHQCGRHPEDLQSQKADANCSAVIDAGETDAELK